MVAEQAQAIQVHNPASSNISQVRFDGNTDTLTVEFLDGKIYDYMNVPAAVYRDFANATSAGQFFFRNIRSRYSYEEQ